MSRGAPRKVAAGGREVEVVIHRLAPGGDGVGRETGPPGSPTVGRVVFVPATAPGDRALVSLSREKGRMAWGELRALQAPSEARVAPGCGAFPVCGGCQWRHVGRPIQHAAKQAIVARALGLPDVPLLAPVPADGYRERARLHGDAQGRLGFLAARSRAVVPLEICPQLAGPLAAVLRCIAALGARAMAARAGATWDLQAGREGVVLAVTPGTPGVSAGELAGLLLDALAPAGVLGVRVAGASRGVEDVDVSEPDGPSLRVPAGGFSQVSGAANAALVAAVKDGVGPHPGEVVELYAGSGNFTRHLSEGAGQVSASDGDARAVARGRRNVPGARWHVGAPQGLTGDTVVLDPPRAGADDAHLVIALRARRRVVYVSCDPQTLGRDAAVLAQGGFTLRAVTAFDLMPQTFHVETVAVFERI